MNSWKFNSTASWVLISGISSSLKIPRNDVYKTVKTTYYDVIETKDGKKYKLILEEI